jgi:hypothetical protein
MGRGPVLHIKTASFSFNLKALEPIILPSCKGSTLRGGFGYAFKRVVCATPPLSNQFDDLGISI